MGNNKNHVPQPGPASLKRSAGPDEWLEAAKDCKYLSEHHMKQLCELVKEYMMEGGDTYTPCQCHTDRDDKTSFRAEMS